MADANDRRRRWWYKRSTAGWRTVLIAEANRLEADLDALPQDASPHRTTAEEAIGRIRESAAPPGGVFERLMDWFGGARIERG